MKTFQPAALATCAAALLGLPAQAQDVNALVKAAAGDKPVVIAETGWPSRGQPVGDAVPSPDHALHYFVTVRQWARREGVKMFYFASFDEPWKRRQEGDVGPEWGLWDKDERLKYGG